MLLTILTWNVWFNLNSHFEHRVLEILNISMESNPDVICFQEVIPQFIEILKKYRPVEQEYKLSSFDDDMDYFNLILVKNILSNTFSFVEFPSTMGRQLVSASIMLDEEIVSVGNVHLESLNNANVRMKQLTVSQLYQAKYSTAFLVGDFNFCSYSNFDKSEKVLENNILPQILPSYVDIWMALHNKLNDCISEVCMGYTYDSMRNGMINHKNERARYDRIMLRSSSWHPISIELIGEHPIDSSNLVWPSDHFGLLGTFSNENKGIQWLSPSSVILSFWLYGENLLLTLALIGLIMFAVFVIMSRVYRLQYRRHDRHGRTRDNTK